MCSVAAVRTLSFSFFSFLRRSSSLEEELELLSLSLELSLGIGPGLGWRRALSQRAPCWQASESSCILSHTWELDA